MKKNHFYIRVKSGSCVLLESNQYRILRKELIKQQLTKNQRVMKHLKNLLLLSMIACTIGFQSCKKNDAVPEVEESIIPGNFMVDIPQSISDVNASKSGSDTLNGNEIYQHLRTFIHVGESSAMIVNHIMFAIKVHKINKAMSLSYTSDDDGRAKNLVVLENADFDGKTWEYQLTITDVLSESNADGGKGIQVFWNQNPVEGIAIMKPYNTDRTENAVIPDAIFRIDYSEAGQYGYDAHMIVSIANLPLANPLVDPYSMKTLKMFAGKSGDVVDVFGNSDHPNAKFFTDSTGFNWAFVASGNQTTNIGVAEVGLPSRSLDETSRTVLLKDYSIKNVFTDEINRAWPGIDSATVAGYLHNTEAPGYFDTNGFIQGGTSPGSQYDPLETIMNKLSPYNPKDISNLTISFK